MWILGCSSLPDCINFTPQIQCHRGLFVYYIHLAIIVDVIDVKEKSGTIEVIEIHLFIYQHMFIHPYN